MAPRADLAWELIEFKVHISLWTGGATVRRETFL